MEELGSFISRYNVVKVEGIFSKHSRFLYIHENGIEFKQVAYNKALKNRDVLHYKDFHGAAPSSSNDKEVAIKAAKQAFTVTCSSKMSLLVDLFLYKDLWDLTNSSALGPGIKRFESYKEGSQNDAASCIPTRITLMRSALLVECMKASEEEKEEKAADKYLIKYNNVLCVVMLPYAVVIHTKVFSSLCVD